jgi:putative thymidylate synthase, flavin-dependent
MIRFVQPWVKEIPQPTTLEEAFRLGELAGRISHRSEGKITPDSWRNFIKKMEKLNHLSVLEFAPMYLSVPFDVPTKELEDNEYTKTVYGDRTAPGGDGYKYITTNYRVLVENGWTDMTKYWKVTPHHYLRHMFHVQTSIEITREWNRHRKLSIVEQSTRYVLATRDGCLPICYGVTPFDNAEVDYFKEASKVYSYLIHKGRRKDAARRVLPLMTATQAFYSGFEDDWKKFIKDRTSTSAHENIRPLAEEIEKMIYGK